VPESRNKTIETINSRQMVKIELAAAVELDSSRLSDYMKHRPLSPERVQKIEDAVEKIAFVWDTCSPFRVVIDSPELLEQAYSEARLISAFRKNPDAIPLEAVRL
jgi:hypothetical protein